MGPDMGFRPLADSVVTTGTNAYGLTLDRWHHVALTYNGAESGQLTERLFVDGSQVNMAEGISLSIRRHPSVILGSFRWADGTSGPEASSLGLGRLRVHDGLLSASQIASNFITEAPSYIPSPSITPSNTGTATITASNTASVSRTASLTRTPTGSRTATASLTGSNTGSVSSTASFTSSVSSSNTGTPSSSATNTPGPSQTTTRAHINLI